MMDKIRWFVNYLKDNFVGNLFYLNRVRAKDKPPESARLYWSIWTGQAIVLVLLTLLFGKQSFLIWGFWTLILAFLAGEGSALGIRFKFIFRGRGTTYSEWNWWYIRNGLIRALWGYTMAGTVMFYWHPIPGSLLALWLTLHLALKGREPVE